MGHFVLFSVGSDRRAWKVHLLLAIPGHLDPLYRPSCGVDAAAGAKTMRRFGKNKASWSADHLFPLDAGHADWVYYRYPSQFRRGRNGYVLDLANAYSACMCDAGGAG
jgi:hypothetical protein